MMLINMKAIFIFAFFAVISNQATVVVNGGQVSINGAITNTQIDIMVNYTANVKWLGIVFSKDQVNTDIHILIVDESNAANPVKVNDCYLDENSHIVLDDVQNIQPSITNYGSSIVPYGLKVAYNRDLYTGDLQDKRFYPDEVIEVCFLSSLQEFQGDGYEQGHQKICTFFSLHKAPDYFQDRLLGNYAATSLFGGSNLTVYATQSTEAGAPESWLFLAIVHKQQGLSPYNGKWIGVTYKDSLSQTDLAVIQYGYRDFTTQIHILDMYITDSTLAKLDISYIQNQGGDDVIQNLGALDSSNYMVAQYKRKFSTGDVNRDIDIISGANKFCFILGDNLAYTSFVQTQRTCFEFNLSVPYYSNFRVKEETEGQTIEYTQPSNSVKVIKVQDGEHIYLLSLAAIILIVLAVF